MDYLSVFGGSKWFVRCFSRVWYFQSGLLSSGGMNLLRTMLGRQFRMLIKQQLWHWLME